MESTAIAFIAAVAAMVPVSGSMTPGAVCATATSAPAVAAAFDYQGTARRERAAELTEYEAWLIAQHHAALASASWMFAPAGRPARRCAVEPELSAER